MLGRPIWRDGLRARAFQWPPLRLARLCLEHESVGVVCPQLSRFVYSRLVGRGRVRAIGLDIHRAFCEVAIHEGGESRSAGRVMTTPEALGVFASSLGREDWVAMEVSGNAAEIARIIEPHVAGVVVVSPSDTGIRQARAKTD